MGTRFGWLILVIVPSVVTISAQMPDDHGNRGRSSGPATVCHFHESADNAAAQGFTPALIGARTVFVISELPPADNGRSVGQLRHELQRWHRWEEVSHRDAADVTLSISVIRGEGGGATLTLGIRARATGAVLWASDGHDVAAVLKVLEDRLPPLEGVCAPSQVL